MFDDDCENTNMKMSAEMRRLRHILFVVHTSVWGGAEVFLRNLAIEFVARGHTVVIAAPTLPSIADRLAGLEGVIVIPWKPGMPAGRARGLGVLASYLPGVKSRLRELLIGARDLHGCDTVLFQYPDEQAHATVLARDLGYEVAWLFHSKPYRALHRWLLVPSLRVASRHASVIFAISNATRKSLADSGLPEDKLASLRVGLAAVSVARPVPRVRGLIAVVSRLSWNKGVQDIVAAMPSVLAKFPYARLEIAGEGRYRPALERLARRLGIATSVDFLGFVDPAVLYSRAVCLAHATFDPGDSMPTNLLEAARAGIPAVATHWNGIPEIVDHGVTGFLTPPRNVSALSAALEYMLGFPDEVAAMGNTAQKRSLDFTMSSVADRLLQGISANEQHPEPLAIVPFNEMSLTSQRAGHQS